MIVERKTVTIIKLIQHVIGVRDATEVNVGNVGLESCFPSCIEPCSCWHDAVLICGQWLSLCGNRTDKFVKHLCADPGVRYSSHWCVFGWKRWEKNVHLLEHRQLSATCRE